MTKRHGIVFGLGVLLAGCASTGPSKDTLLAMASASQNSEQVGNVTLNSRIISTSAHGDSSGGDYVIGSGDLLVISALDVGELEKVKVRVGSEGFVRLPLIGTVNVKGRTARRLESDIADLLEKYLHNPQVSVFIEEYRSQRVAVLGEVNKPGVYEVSEKRTVTDMLAHAGGLSPGADQVVFILRKTNGVESGSVASGELLKVDLEQLLAGHDPSMNLKVGSGDVISVPKSGEFFLGGSVRKPGAYPIKGKLTVDQAIYLGGGLSDDADVSDIQVVRDVGGPKKELFQLNLDHVKREGKPGLPIQKNDVVYVGTSGPKAFLYGALEFFKSIIRVGVGVSQQATF
ncbi:MAG TPA: SLBB domain-containing protein [Candidatus Methylomirabilis sp.]|nr:SLBB domain-containing protein [Candidatus Methylomirabilis sp.]